MRLGERKTSTLLAGRHCRQKTGSLLVAAMIGDDMGHNQMAVDDAGETHPSARQLRHQMGITDEAEAKAAVSLWDSGAEQAEVLHFGDQPMRIFVVMFQ